MKNYKRGFVAPLLIAIIAVLAIGSGVYVYTKNKTQQPLQTQTTTNNQTVSTSTSQNTNSSSTSQTVKFTKDTDKSINNDSVLAKITVAGIGVQKYTDSDFGFSFWYPSNWQVSKISVADVGFGITNGTVTSALIVGNKDSKGNTAPQISILEVSSPSMTITDTYQVGNDSQTHFFDPAINKWMKSGVDIYNKPLTPSVANVSVKTMGGLYMLDQSVTYDRNTHSWSNDTSIIPIGTKKFLVINGIGNFYNLDNINGESLAKTVSATDTTVAIPASTSEQEQVIREELSLLTALKTVIDLASYTDSQNRFSFNYPVRFNGKKAEMQTNGKPQVFVTTGENIDLNGCYTTDNPNGQNDIQVTINNIQFCYSVSSDVGVGQAYHDYYYTTKKDENYITIGYIIHTSNGCGAVKGYPSYVSCKYFFDNYDDFVVQPIQKSAGSLNFDITKF